MPTVDDYLSRVTAEHRKPKFLATVAATVAPLVAVQEFLASLPAAFDLDVAVGAQLDIVGLWIGRSRTVEHPVDGIYFTWDDPIRGWDQGYWQGPYDTPLGTYGLVDDDYRRLLRAKILANEWDGTLPGLQAILDAYFIDPAIRVFVQDAGLSTAADEWFTWDDPNRGWDQASWQPVDYIPPPVDMAIVIGVAGKLPSAVDLSLLGQNLIVPEPIATRVEYAVTSVDNAPVFGWDMDNEFVAGWDVGAWDVTPEYAAENPPA